LCRILIREPMNEVRIAKANFQGVSVPGVQVTEGKTTELPCALKPDLSGTWLTVSKDLPQSVIRAACYFNEPDLDAKLRYMKTVDLGHDCNDLSVTGTKQQGMLLKAEISRSGATIAYLVLTVNENGDELSGTITEYSTGNASPIAFKRVQGN
jgi:hypothetical protein